MYAQDSSTFGRLTVHGGLRLDYAHSYAPEQPLFQQSFVPKGILYPETEIVKGFLDLSPRVGVAYDLRGDGKTSVKVSLGRYLAAVNADGIYASTAPVALIGGGGARTAPSTTRSWTDRNGNFVPDCDLMNKATNGECGPWGTQNFGEVLTSAVDPTLTGNNGMWYRRPYDWGFGLSVQHELRPRLSVEASYNRRWWGNRSVVDNLLVGPTDFNAYSVQAPVDSRLPGGGGYVIGDLQDVSSAKFGATSNFEVFTSNFGNDVRYFHAVDVNLRGQLRGVTLRASTTTGRQVTDTCELIFDSPSLRNCHVALPFQTTFSGLAAYTLPKVDVQTSARDPELARESDLGKPRVYLGPGRADPGAAALGGHGQRDGQPARSGPDVSRPDQSRRPPVRESDQIWPEAAQRWRRRLQRVELQRGPQFEQYLWHGLADANVGADCATDAIEREIRLLDQVPLVRSVRSIRT